MKRDWKTGFLFGYLFFIFAVTVLTREADTFEYRLMPLWSWEYIFIKWPLSTYRKMILVQILLNIAMFIPIGFLFGRIIAWKSILAGFGFSLLIELTQLITRRGLFEIDDLIHNTLGAVIGYGLFILITHKVNTNGKYQQIRTNRNKEKRRYKQRRLDQRAYRDVWKRTQSI